MCGLGAIINTSVQKFNKSVFNIIGIANDVRGGDSCGIFIDGEYEYGIGKERLYQDFFYTSELLEKTKECRLAFLHCRKASPGLKVNLASAQPVIIQEDGVVKYVLMHNGTIHNSEELAKKYIPEINVKDLTDSQIMARIFYYKGYDALAEYNGSAVFIIADYRNNSEVPQVFVWKGESKDTAYSKVSEERPLYFVNTKKYCVFSSIALQLDAIYGEENVYTISSNSLIELKNGSLYVVKTYDRSKQQQAKVYSSNTYSNSNYNRSNYSNAGYYIYSNKLGEFMCGGEKVHGKKYCSSAGLCYSYEIYGPSYKQFWFYQGVLLYNKDCFDIIEETRKEFAKQDPKYLQPASFIRDFPEIVCYFSYLPIRTSEAQKYFIVNEDLLWEPFTGKSLNILSIYNSMEYKDGKVVSCTYGNSQIGFDNFQNVSERYYFDKLYFINLINQQYNVSIRLDDEISK